MIGKNTVAAMQSGIIYGYVGQVEGIVSRIKAQSKENPPSLQLVDLQSYSKRDERLSI